MIEFILSLPTWLGFGAAMVVTAVVGLVVYFVSYKLISKYQSYDLMDPTALEYLIETLQIGAS
jgi:hypothetical protein